MPARSGAPAFPWPLRNPPHTPSTPPTPSAAPPRPSRSLSTRQAACPFKLAVRNLSEEILKILWLQPLLQDCESTSSDCAFPGCRVASVRRTQKQQFLAITIDLALQYAPNLISIRDRNTFNSPFPASK